MTTSMRTLRNAVLLGVGLMLALVLADQSQASAGTARGSVIGQPCYYCGSGTTIYDQPLEAPYVTQVSPQGGATGVPRNTNVKVTFSEEMDPSTINGSTFQLHTYDNLLGGVFFNTEQISATVSKDPTDTSGRTYLLDPYGATTSSLLSANRKYRVTVTTGVRDQDESDTIDANKVWYFTTGSY